LKCQILAKLIPEACVSVVALCAGGETKGVEGLPASEGNSVQQ